MQELNEIREHTIFNYEYGNISIFVREQGMDQLQMKMYADAQYKKELVKKLIYLHPRASIQDVSECVYTTKSGKKFRVDQAISMLSEKEIKEIYECFKVWGTNVYDPDLWPEFHDLFRSKELPTDELIKNQLYWKEVIDLKIERNEEERIQIQKTRDKEVKFQQEGSANKKT